MDCSLPSFSVHGILCPWDSLVKNTNVGCHALPRESSQPKDQTCVSYLCLLPVSPTLAGGFFTASTTWEALNKLIILHTHTHTHTHTRTHTHAHRGKRERQRDRVVKPNAIWPNNSLSLWKFYFPTFSTSYSLEMCLTISLFCFQLGTRSMRFRMGSRCHCFSVKWHWKRRGKFPLI